jgi:hypothetical protein
MPTNVVKLRRPRLAAAPADQAKCYEEVDLGAGPKKFADFLKRKACW